MGVSRANPELYWLHPDHPYSYDFALDGSWTMRLYRLYSESTFAEVHQWLYCSIEHDNVMFVPFDHSGHTIVRVSFRRKIDARRFLLEFA